MAIAENAAIEFFGTQTTVTVSGGTSAVTDGSFSVVGDVVSGNFTNADDAPEAAFVAFFDWNTTGPDANSSVGLFAVLLDIDGTSDQDLPSANYHHVYLGSFPVKDILTNQFVPLDVTLPNTKSSQIYQFYIQNNTGQTIQAGWTLKVTTKTLGPHPA